MKMSWSMHGSYHRAMESVNQRIEKDKSES